MAAESDIGLAALSGLARDPLFPVPRDWPRLTWEEWAAVAQARNRENYQGMYDAVARLRTGEMVLTDPLADPDYTPSAAQNLITLNQITVPLYNTLGSSLAAYSVVESNGWDDTNERYNAKAVSSDDAKAIFIVGDDAIASSEAGLGYGEGSKVKVLHSETDLAVNELLGPKSGLNVAERRDDGIMIVEGVVSQSNGSPGVALVKFPFKGGAAIAASATYAVKVWSDGGSNGDETTQCSKTYTVRTIDATAPDAGGELLGSTMTPLKERPTTGTLVTAPATGSGTIGLGYDYNDVFYLYDANETLNTDACT